MAVTPTLRLERELLRCGAARVAGIDEVGRGALAGPVSVGVAVVDATTRTAPRGLRDSKLLAAPRRQELAPLLREWAVESAVGHASSAEIDAHGILAALRLAALRALQQCGPVDMVILDGTHDWLTVSAGPASDAPDPGWTLFSESSDPDGVRADARSRTITQPAPATPAVVTRRKGDMHCSSVAAASVLAKVTRDGQMQQLHQEHPDYSWSDNMGYGTAVHSDAIRRIGISGHHRATWSMAGGSARDLVPKAASEVVVPT